MNLQYAHYTRFAAELTTNGYKPPERSLTSGERHVLVIYSLLSDGKWHTAADIMVVTGSKSKAATRLLMSSIKSPLAIASGQQGYCIPQPQQTSLF